MNNCLEKTLISKNIKFYYRDWGGSGQKIILLHGLASNSRIWDFVAPILSSRFRVVAVDQRGHGLTDKPFDGYDFLSIVDDLKYFLDEIDFMNPIIVGHSWGAMVALSYAAKYSYLARGLCLVDGGTTNLSLSDLTYIDMKKKMTPPVFSGTSVKKFKDSIKLKLNSSNNSLLEDIILSNFNIINDKILEAKLSLNNHMKIIESIWNYKPSDIYKIIKIPVLLMPARQASVIDKYLLKYNGINEALTCLDLVKLIWLEDSIHDVPLQRPELLVNNIIKEFNSGFFNI